MTSKLEVNTTDGTLSTLSKQFYDDIYFPEALFLNHQNLHMHQQTWSNLQFCKNWIKRLKAVIAGLVEDYVTLPVQRAGDQFGDLAVRQL